MIYPTTGYTPAISERTRLNTSIQTCTELAAEIPQASEYWTNRAEQFSAQLAVLDAPAVTDNTMLIERLSWLESAIDEATPAAQHEMLSEIIELRNQLQLDGWADEQYDGRIMSKNLADTF